MPIDGEDHLNSDVAETRVMETDGVETDSTSFHAGLVKGSGSGLASRTRSLLHTRLRAAGIVLTGAWSLGILRTLFVPGAELMPGHLVALALAGGSTAILSYKPELSLRQLRALELVMIFSTAAIVADFSLRMDPDITRPESEALLVAFLGRTLTTYIWLMLVYGMLIPNTWRRAAWVIGAIALFPIGIRVAFRIQYPSLSEVLSLDEVSFTLLVLVVAAVSAVYGTHVINTLRKEAHQARKLGQYQLMDRIGRGAMGEVWRARHQMLARPAAVKLIRPEMLGDLATEDTQMTLRRFEREARATAGLKSPNSIVVYDFGTTDEGTFYYVMELLDGLNLEALVDRFGPVSAPRVIYILSQACDSLADAHRSGLIHRDIKPANLYLCRLGPVTDFLKVLDFGLVKARADSETDETRLTKVGMTAGTPAYMAPEQVLGQAVDERTDLYALGCVGYWLLTGTTVFEGDSSMGVIIDHVKSAPRPPSERTGRELPGDLERVILDCLAKDPADRPSSASELQRSLAACGAAGFWDRDQASEWWAHHMSKPKAQNPEPRTYSPTATRCPLVRK